MTRREFEKVVKEALDSLPPRLRARIENVQVSIRESPDRRLVAEHGAGLYGLYEGVSLDQRSHDFAGALPDRITIFKRTIERDHPGRDSMIQCIRDTVIHEVGHFFGFDDDDLDRMGIG
jgi:predicted Zn-dependent protease with MMP-like domain